MVLIFTTHSGLTMYFLMRKSRSCPPAKTRALPRIARADTACSVDEASMCLKLIKPRSSALVQCFKNYVGSHRQLGHARAGGVVDRVGDRRSNANVGDLRTSFGAEGVRRLAPTITGSMSGMSRIDGVRRSRNHWLSAVPVLWSKQNPSVKA